MLSLTLKTCFRISSIKNTILVLSFFIVIPSFSQIFECKQGKGQNSLICGFSNKAAGYKASAVGIDNEAIGTYSSAIGYDNESEGYGSSALGLDNNAEGYQSVALGASNEASARRSSAIGYDNEAQGYDSSAIGYDNETANFGASAVGYSNETKGRLSSSFGSNNYATGSYSTTVGYANSINATNSYVFGGKNKLYKSATNTIVLSPYSQDSNGTIVTNIITSPNSVILGAGSSGTATVFTGNSAKYYKPGSTAYHFAGKPNSKNGVVSIGSAGKERQIKFVAAGQISANSTDAVNGSQLYAITQAINTMSKSNKLLLPATELATEVTTTSSSLTFSDDNGDKVQPTTNLAIVGNSDTSADSNGYSSKNIRTVAKDDKVIIQMADKVSLQSISADAVSVGNITISQNGRITGVADAKEANDAVTYRQLNTTVNAMGQNLHHRIDKIEDRAYAGIASAAALAAVPQSTEYGKSSLGVGVGGFGDKHAVAVGYSYNTQGGNWKIKAGASVNNGKRALWNAGVGYSW